MIVNSSLCATANGGFAYTGTDHYPVNIKSVRVLAFVKGGETFGTLDSPTPIDLDYIQVLQVAKKAVILNNYFEFTQAVIEDSLKENPDTGASIVVRKNPYDFTVVYENAGTSIDNELRKLESYGYWDVLMFDDSGTLLYTTKVDGTLKGFSTGMVAVGQFQTGKGNEGTKSTVRFQLTSPEEMSNRKAWVIESELTFNAKSELGGVNLLTLTVPAPINGATSIAFNIFDITKGVPSEIFTTSNVTAKIDGVVTAGAVASTGSGGYTKAMTVATGDVVGFSVPIAVIAGKVYEGPEVTAVTT